MYKPIRRRHFRASRALILALVPASLVLSAACARAQHGAARLRMPQTAPTMQSGSRATAKPPALTPVYPDTPLTVEPLTQNRINEFAAACVTAQIAFHGYKGNIEPGETPAQFHARVAGYIAALEKVEKELAPLRKAPPARDWDAVNAQRWRNVAANTDRLPGEIAALRAAWKAYPVEGERAQLGVHVYRAVVTLQAILNGLRDARP